VDRIDKLSFMIRIQRFEGFYHVATHGGYARAARAMPYPITQPAVHQQVKKLEQELDRPLFERVGKDRLLLTPAGRKLFAFVAPFFDGLDAVLRAVQADDGHGELSVAAEPLMLRHLLPPWLARLQARSPNARVDLRELTETEFAPLTRGDVDLLVGYLPDPPPGVAFQRIASLTPFLVLPAQHAKASRRRLAPRDLAGDSFIAYRDGMLARELQIRALETYSVAPHEFAQASSADTILGFVGSGLGWSLVPSLDPHGEFGPAIAARPLARLRADFPVIAAWRRDAPENALLDAALATAPRP
jgi:DNA-binding transcriptional LysR family regulator